MKPEERIRLYEEWKASQRSDEETVTLQPVPEHEKPPLPPEPEMTAAEAVRRRRNREKYPEIAAFLDDCRRYFGADVEIVKLEER